MEKLIQLAQTLPISKATEFVREMSSWRVTEAFVARPDFSPEHIDLILNKL